MDTDVKLWRYHLPRTRLLGQAVFVLGSDGFFSVVSDYGNHAVIFDTKTWNRDGTKDFRRHILLTRPQHLVDVLYGNDDTKRGIRTLVNATMPRLCELITAELEAEKVLPLPERKKLPSKPVL